MCRHGQAPGCGSTRVRQGGPIGSPSSRRRNDSVGNVPAYGLRCQIANACRNRPQLGLRVENNRPLQPKPAFFQFANAIRPAISAGRRLRIDEDVCGSFGPFNPFSIFVAVAWSATPQRSGLAGDAA